MNNGFTFLCSCHLFEDHVETILVRAGKVKDLEEAVDIVQREIQVLYCFLSLGFYLCLHTVLVSLYT